MIRHLLAVCKQTAYSFRNNSYKIDFLHCLSILTFAIEADQTKSVAACSRISRIYKNVRETLTQILFSASTGSSKWSPMQILTKSHVADIRRDHFFQYGKSCVMGESKDATGSILSRLFEV